MGTIEREWSVFRQAVLREFQDPEDLETMRQVFYAGALVMERAMLDKADLETPEAGVRRLIGLHDEIQAYLCAQFPAAPELFFRRAAEPV